MGKEVIVVETRKEPFILSPFESYILEYVKMRVSSEIRAYLNSSNDDADCDISLGFNLEDGKTVHVAIGTNANELMCSDWMKACLGDDSGERIPDEKTGFGFRAGEKNLNYLQFGIAVFFGLFYTDHGDDQEWTDTVFQAIVKELQDQNYIAY